MDRRGVGGDRVKYILMTGARRHTRTGTQADSDWTIRHRHRRHRRRRRRQINISFDSLQSTTQMIN